jgi:AAT family amino acid transporter
MTFERLGIKTAAGIINFVVITAALSSSNGGIFSTGRMLFSLAQNGHAPKSFTSVSKSGVPHIALLSTMLILLLGVLLNYLMPEKIFNVVTSIATFSGIWTWVMILLTQIKFRRSLSADQAKALSYRMWLWPFSSYLALAFLAFVIGLLAYFEETRIALYVGILFMSILTLIYFMYLNKPKDGKDYKLNSVQ